MSETPQMPQGTPPPGAPPPGQRKGLSKGCIVALIVAGALLVIIVASLFVCYHYRNEMMGMAISQQLAEVQRVMHEDPPDGVNVDEFDGLLGAFNDSLTAEEDFVGDEAKMGEIQAMLTEVRGFDDDGQVSIDEIRTIYNSIIAMYPGLADDYAVFEDETPSGTMPDTTASDTVGTQ